MSLDLSAALRDAAERAPVGTLEPTTLGRRIRRRRAAQTAARSAGGVGLAGVLAVAATQTPGLLGRSPGGSVPGLPADEVAHELPRADPDAAPGECGWVVEPAAEPEVDLGVALDTYQQRSYLALPVSLTVHVPAGFTLRDPVDVVVAKDGVVVARASRPHDFAVADDPGPHTIGSWSEMALTTCGGADATKALPDGEYVMYGVLAGADGAGPAALSPGQPLVVAGNVRERWCGADLSVLPRRDDRVQIDAGSVDDVSMNLLLVWKGDAEASMVSARTLLVDDRTGRIVSDSDTWDPALGRLTADLDPGSPLPLTPAVRTTSCVDDAPLPSGTYRVYSVVTVAPTSRDTGGRLTVNATGVAEAAGTLTVP
ncbi:hypothetical protein [Cellulomonas sp. P5_C5]